jgi:hypothetical protein
MFLINAEKPQLFLSAIEVSFEVRLCCFRLLQGALSNRPFFVKNLGPLQLDPKRSSFCAFRYV